MSSLTLNKAVVSQVDLGFTKIEGLMLPNGTYAVAVPQVADLFSIPNKHASRDFKALLGLDHLDKIKSELNSQDVNIIYVAQILELIHILASQGNKVAYKMLHRKECPIRTSQCSERVVQLSLWEKLGGEIEVPCLAGRIDILTSIEIIEVKRVFAWKSALGQILVYGSYYPIHQKRIHLFGKTDRDNLGLIKKHCDNFQVVVTWQPTVK